MKRKISTWLPVILWMLIIFIFSAQPASTSSKMSGSVMQFVISIIDVTPIPEILGENLLHTLVRKTAHFSIYLVLGALVLRAGNREGWSRKYIYTFAICLLYAMTDEFHQLFIPGRSGQIEDVLIDSSGSCLGIFLMKHFSDWRK